MKNGFMRNSPNFYIILIGTFCCCLLGCGGEDDREDTDTLYEELAGMYELFRGELTFLDGTAVVLEPPDIAGSMTVSSDRRITQQVEAYGNSLTIKGAFELFPDEGVIEIDSESVAILSKPTYTWNGSVFTITTNVGTFIQKSFWRKL